MTINLVQNYIKSAPYVNSEKNKPEFDIQRIIDTKTFIQPLPSRGKLIDGKFSNIPELTLKETVYNAKAFKHALCGKANDHELGKMNDLGLKLGSLAIAIYLFSMRKSPLNKCMEFVGLTSFLASMALWPKIAIQLPAYLVHGVNVGKKYQDGYGRVKPFYQDPQFIPWDLYSDDEINKIGDKLKVPRNIPNRREFIQEKMRKIALQNNTLWMLTAGFAAPIMSALICNLSEPAITKLINDSRNKEANGILKDFDRYVGKHKTKKTETALEKLYAEQKNSGLDDVLREKIKTVFTSSMDSITSSHFRKDFDAKYPSNKFFVSRENAQKLIDELSKLFLENNYDGEFVKFLFQDEKHISNLLNNNKLLNTAITDYDFRNIKSIFIKDLKSNYDKYYRLHPDVVPENWEEIADLIFNQPRNNHPLVKAFRQTPDVKFDKAMFDELKVLAADTDVFVSKVSALDRYAGLKVGAAPETVGGNFWNKINEELINDVFKFTPEEIKKANLDENIMGYILRDKIETVTSDDASYKRVIKAVIEKFARLENELKSENITSHILNKHDKLSFEENRESRTLYDRITDNIYDEFAEILKKNGFPDTSKAISGKDMFDNCGTAKSIQKAYVQDRLLGIKSAFYRLINTLDFYRRVSTDANNIDGIKGQCRNIKEELIELCKTITLEGHSSDQTTKFYMLRNPEPDLFDGSDVKVVNGKVKNKYYGVVKETADIPHDKYFYQYAMRAMYEAPMHKDTEDAIKEIALRNEAAMYQDTQKAVKQSLLRNEMVNYRELMCEKFGGEHYFTKPFHKIRPFDDTGSEVKFLLNGISPKEMLFKKNQLIFNTNKWFKIFSTAGAVLLGVTLAAQFAFGKMKNPKKAGQNA